MILKAKKWLIIYFTVLIVVLGIIAARVFYVDPFFHYHKPLTDKYYYELDNQRSQNYGIVKHFEYDAIITGNSMTENFKTSEVDRILGTTSIKVSLSGTSNKETSDLIRTALEANPNLRMVIRGFTLTNFLTEADYLPTEFGQLPVYLYNDNPFDDVFYLFNRDVLFSRIYSMDKNRAAGIAPGITSFDDYSFWSNIKTYGKNTVLKYDDEKKKKQQESYSNQERGENDEQLSFGSISDENEDTVVVEDYQILTNWQKNKIKKNVYENVISLAEDYPQVEFYCLILPYSAVWWKNMVNSNGLERCIESEKTVIREMLNCPNIHLFSFDMMTDITTDLNNYKDHLHYGEWINTLILKYISEGRYQLTQENYNDYMNRVQEFYSSFDYNYLQEQDDYSQDFQALFNIVDELRDVMDEKAFDREFLEKGSLNNAEIVGDQLSGMPVIVCHGTIDRSPDGQGEESLEEYLYNKEYNGLRVELEDLEGYRWLIFSGKKTNGHGQPAVYIYNSIGELCAKYYASYRNIDEKWHTYGIDLSKLEGSVTIIFHGGYVDNTGSINSEYVFSDIRLLK